MAVINTEKFAQHPEWTMGGNPDAIRQQEADGQQQILVGEDLPVIMMVRGEPKDAKKEYEKLGIIVLKKADDALFYSVQLPTGWVLKPTKHSVFWTDLYNHYGTKMASIFYKAAFYERRAHVMFGND